MKTTFTSPNGPMSTHGNHWSFPVSSAGQVPLTDVGRWQSRLAGCSEGSSLTRVGPSQVVPPSIDLKRNTSVFELRTVPFRLSDITKYRSSANAPPRLSTTRFPPEFTRKHELVKMLRFDCPRTVQSARPRLGRG